MTAISAELGARGLASVAAQRTLSVIVLAYNEEATIGTIVAVLLEHVPDVLEIIVVDDGSVDRTRSFVEKLIHEHPQVRLLAFDHNQGKTNAIRAGFAASQGDLVLVQDADLEYDPSDIPNLIQPIVDNRADVVFGSRFLVRGATRVLYFRHYLANKFLTFLSNVLTDSNFSDVETGYKAFRGQIARSMIIDATGFGCEIEVTAKIAKLGCRVYEVPISYTGGPTKKVKR